MRVIVRGFPTDLPQAANMLKLNERPCKVADASPRGAARRAGGALKPLLMRFLFFFEGGSRAGFVF